MIASQDNRDNKVLIYDSEDLIYYGNERIVTLTDSGIVKDPIAEYDPSVMAYRIYWVDAAGQGYEARTRDFVNFTAPAKADYSRERVTGTVPRYAKESMLAWDLAETNMRHWKRNMAFCTIPASKNRMIR